MVRSASGSSANCAAPRPMTPSTTSSWFETTSTTKTTYPGLEAAREVRSATTTAWPSAPCVVRGDTRPHSGWRGDGLSAEHDPSVVGGGPTDGWRCNCSRSAGSSWTALATTPSGDPSGGRRARGSTRWDGCGTRSCPTSSRFRGRRRWRRGCSNSRRIVHCRAAIGGRRRCPSWARIEQPQAGLDEAPSRSRCGQPLHGGLRAEDDHPSPSASWAHSGSGTSVGAQVTMMPSRGSYPGQPGSHRPSAP